MNDPLDQLGPERRRRAADLLNQAGLVAPLRWAALRGGANNQAFRVDAPGRSVLLKAYFVHADDPRDRLRADHGFASFSWAHGVRTSVRPLACDAPGQLALFEYLNGVKLTPAEVTWPRVREALDFYLSVNAHRHAAEARALPPAAEACFTLREHLDCLRRRLARLRFLDVTTPVDREAAALVRGELSDQSEALFQQLDAEAAAFGVAPEEAVAEEDRCLSPSDFGFHNALRTGDGRLRFFDFEYAGWDDPGKLVADFFCQPECPVPGRFFEPFAVMIAQRTTRPEWHLRRFRLLLPVYRLKWCCILLNDFLPAGEGRRRFARGSGAEERKAEQLRKARAALHGETPADRWRLVA